MVEAGAGAQPATGEIDEVEHQRALERQARRAAALEQAAEAVLITGPTGAILDVNAAFEALSGERASIGCTRRWGGPACLNPCSSRPPRRSA